MKQIVVNRCYGGFHLSPKGLQYYYKLKNITLYFYYQSKHQYLDGCDEYQKYENLDKEVFSYYAFTIDLGDSFKEWSKDADTLLVSSYDIDRDDPLLVKTVLDLGKDASGPCSLLQVVNIPDNVEWEISDYDGYEHIEEKHRKW